MICTASVPAAAGAAPCRDPGALRVTAAALSAYEGMEPRAASGSDPLADFLAVELYRGSAGETESARFERAARQVDAAISSLQHVSEQLHERASTSACLPLPLGPAGAATETPLPAS